MQLPSGRLGIGTYSNSSVTAARRWITILQTKLAAGTNIKQFTQAETLMSTIEGVFVQAIPSFANDKATGSFVFYPSLTSANTIESGTFTVLAHGKTLNRITRLHVACFGTPDEARVGA